MDEMRYLDWRDACAAVDDAYRGWPAATGDSTGRAYAACLAALDREESAARSYAEVVDRMDAVYSVREYASAVGVVPKF
jgi:hypothetical protein